MLEATHLNSVFEIHPERRNCHSAWQGCPQRFAVAKYEEFLDAMRYNRALNVRCQSSFVGSQLLVSPMTQLARNCASRLLLPPLGTMIGVGWLVVMAIGSCAAARLAAF